MMHTGLVEMRGTTAPRLVLELMCARMLLPAASTSDGALLQRLERMERRASISLAPVPHGESAAAPPSGPDAAQSQRLGGGSRAPAGPSPRPRGRRTVRERRETPVSEERAEAVATDRVERPEPVRAAIDETPDSAAVNQAPEPTVQPAPIETSTPPGRPVGQEADPPASQPVGEPSAPAAPSSLDAAAGAAWSEILAAAKQRSP